jgi:5'-nucleotidase
MSTKLHRLLVLTAVVAVVFVAHAPRGLAQSKPLAILLTNDDGFDSSGLKVMHAALVAAGHRVTVVAPATNMSSSSMSMTSGALKVEQKGDAVWAVAGTPTDAVMLGLVHLLKTAPQDLVISGTNAGQNLGSSTNGSGTVSAALAASRFGVPAIATSAGLGPNAGAAYDVAAALVIDLIAGLQAGQPTGARLLPDRLVINVNVPAVPRDALKGLRWAPLSRMSSYARVYEATSSANEVRSRLTLSTATVNETDTDLVLFGQGYVTLTLLDGDLSAGATRAAAGVTSRLAKLGLPLKKP